MRRGVRLRDVKWESDQDVAFPHTSCNVFQKPGTALGLENRAVFLQPEKRKGPIGFQKWQFIVFSGNEGVRLKP